MKEPKLKRTTVEVGFSCDDGYSRKTKFLTGKNPPEHAMIGAIRELTRMAYLYGHGEAAADAYHEAKEAIEEFKSGTED